MGNETCLRTFKFLWGGSVLFSKHCLCMFVFTLVWGRLATTIKFPWNQFTTFSAKISLDIIIFTFRKKKNISLSQLKNLQKMNRFLSSLVFQPSPPPFWRLVLEKSPSQPILTVPSFCFPLFYRRLKWKTLDFWGVGVCGTFWGGGL